MKFTERFNEVIKFSGKKQTEIAAAIKVSKQCVSDYKSGKSVPSIETLYLLCEFLDVSSDYLLGLSDEF
ncbi:MAG: helix-turn-helix transcriptional regulator [Clostridia bacterium]|nr:helix-turn-helix transcriptional regulator [Clostridia bacterium]